MIDGKRYDKGEEDVHWLSSSLFSFVLLFLIVLSTGRFIDLGCMGLKLLMVSLATDSIR